jgi:hypothetical protein
MRLALLIRPEMARDDVVLALAHRSLRRVLKHANLRGHRAAGMEAAALREVNRARRLAFDLEPDQLPLMQAGGGGEQCLRVRVAGRSEEPVTAALLNDSPQVHHGNLVAQVPH